MFKKKGLDKNKLKSRLKMAQIRMINLKNRKINEVKIQKKQIATLLSQKKDEAARIKIENVIRDDYLIETIDILHQCCELVMVRADLISETRVCPTDLKEAVSTLVFAAPRLNVEELLHVRELLRAQFGSVFIEGISRDEYVSVNRKVLVRLDLKVPQPSLCIRYIEAIAREYGIEFEESQDEDPYASLRADNTGYTFGDSSGGPNTGFLPSVGVPVNGSHSIGPNGVNFVDSMPYMPPPSQQMADPFDTPLYSNAPPPDTNHFQERAFNPSLHGTSPPVSNYSSLIPPNPKDARYQSTSTNSKDFVPSYHEDILPPPMAPNASNDLYGNDNFGVGAYPRDESTWEPDPEDDLQRRLKNLSSLRSSSSSSSSSNQSNNITHSPSHLIPPNPSTNFSGLVPPNSSYPVPPNPSKPFNPDTPKPSASASIDDDNDMNSIQDLERRFEELRRRH